MGSARSNSSQQSGRGPFSATEIIDTDFISRASHDLRTPLAAIKAAIGVVLANEPPGTTEPLSRMFGNIDRAADQMNSMIANLVEMSRLRAGPSALQPTLTDLNSLTFRIAKLAEPGARRQQQKIEVRVPSETIHAVVDGNRVDRALLNLLDNAQRYGLVGGTIKLSLERRGDDEVVFSVADDGPGAPEASIAHLSSGEASTGGGAGRTGLGLPVANAVAELHGGRLWIDSAPGQGSVVCIALPYDDASTLAIANQAHDRGLNG